MRVSVRHGDVLHCLNFPADAKGGFKPAKKLLVRKAVAGAACPDGGSPSGAFLR